MKILYFDCKNGISGDMVRRALMELSGRREQAEAKMEQNFRAAASHFTHETGHEDSGVKSGGSGGHNHSHDHDHGRSFREVISIIAGSGFSSSAKATARKIYEAIAEAEAEVHGASLETVHFHEVGRDEAIRNALGIGMALEEIAPDTIRTSAIYDGKGTVVCSHGEIPVPVPAVMALRKRCSYVFRQADINMEMVTPSGLASLMGIGAVPDECGRLDALQQAGGSLADGSFSERMPGCRVIAVAEAKGSRDTKRPGLLAYLIECEEDVH